jgi:hypothetical protein
VAVVYLICLEVATVALVLPEDYLAKCLAAEEDFNLFIETPPTPSAVAGGVVFLS